MAFGNLTSIVGASAATAAPPVPAGAAANDIMVVSLYKENTAAVTPPAGFTQKAALATSASAQGSLYIFWKRCTGADSGTYSFSWTGSAWREITVSRFTGRITSGDPFDGTPGTAESLAAAVTLNVSTTLSVSGCDLYGAWTDFAGNVTWTPAAGTTEQFDGDVSTVDTIDNAASGSTGNLTATSSGNDFMKAFLGGLLPATSGATGTLAATEGADTLAAAGAETFTGTLAATEANDTVSGAGTVANPVTGTFASTEAADTLAATGAEKMTGTLAATEASDTLAASGTSTNGVTGTLAASEGNDTLASSGTLAISGALASTEAADTIAVAASERMTGTLAAPEGADGLAATGTERMSGTFAATEANDTLAASGTAGAGTALQPADAEHTIPARVVVHRIAAATVTQRIPATIVARRQTASSTPRRVPATTIRRTQEVP